MDSEKNHIIYTAEDIEKYFSGKLGPAEMHAIEKAALDDAFLAEAMEGYEGMQEKEYKRQLLSVQKNFSKERTAKVIAMKPATHYPVWRVAAAVLIICGGIAIMYKISTKDPSPNRSVAAGKIKQDSPNSNIAETGDSGTGTETTAIITKRDKPGKQPILARDDEKTLADSAFVYRPATVDKKEIQQDSGDGYVEDALISGNEVIAGNTSPSARQNNPEESGIKNKTTLEGKVAGLEIFKKPVDRITNRFTGQVVGQDGTPLPFANISITKEKIGTYADARGNFRLVSADSPLNIEIKSEGYITRNFTLTTGMAQSKIVLSKDQLALEEKTQVTGAALANADKKRRVILVPDTVTNVEPEDGWNNYATYITNNLSIPDDIRQKKIHGEVAISFEVQSNGAITNVKIDKSLCDDCDEAALRVVKEGPRWKVKKGAPGMGKVKVKF